MVKIYTILAPDGALIAGLDGRVAGKIAPGVIDWPVLPITAAVIGRPIGIGHCCERT
jgi:hypothetical protein